MTSLSSEKSVSKARSLLGLTLGVICAFSPAIAFFSFGQIALVAVVIFSILIIISTSSFLKNRIGLIGGLIGLICSIGFLLLIYTQQNAELPVSNLDEAEKQLFMSSGDTVAFGNHEQAVGVSTQIASELEGYLESDQLGEKPTGMSMNGDNVAAYTSLQPKSVVVLLTVPRFKKYSDAGQAKIYSSAWKLAAESVEKTEQVEKGATLAIAIRSGISYSAIHHGPGSQPAPAATDGNEELLGDLFSGQ